MLSKTQVFLKRKNFLAVAIFKKAPVALFFECIPNLPDGSKPLKCFFFFPLASPRLKSWAGPKAKIEQNRFSGFHDLLKKNAALFRYRY